MLGQPVGGGVRQPRDDLDVARHLEPGELLPRERVHGSEVGRAAVGRYDERLHVFLGQVGRHADHRGLDDVGMAFEHLLDLGGRQVLAAPADHFLHAAEEREGLVGVDPHEVAGLEPAVHDHRRRLFGHLVVAAHDGGVAQLELATFARPHDPTVIDRAGVVDVAERRMLARRAERAVWPFAVAPDQRVRRLRQRVAAHDLETEALLDRDLVVLVGRRARVTEANRVVGVVGAPRLPHEDLEHRADAVELGRAERARVVEERARREPG